MTTIQLLEFDRRVLLTSADDFNIDNFDQSVLATLETNIQTYLNQEAANALINNTYTITVDGTVVPQSKYQYGRDYFLGDTIELEGTVGGLQKALVTEYIRSQDNTGETAYPTLTGIT